MTSESSIVVVQLGTRIAERIKNGSSLTHMRSYSSPIVMTIHAKEDVQQIISGRFEQQDTDSSHIGQ